MKPEAVIFDFDGILADTEELHYESYRSVLDPLGIGFSYGEYAERYMAFDAFGCLKQRAQDVRHSAGESEIRRWVEEKNRAYDALIASSEVPPLPGALEAVEQAASHGPVAICTGAVRSDIAPLVKKFALTPHLTAIVTADDVQTSKPDPECYLLACSRLRKDPAVCLAIEDTPGGLRAAKGAGCRTLGVTTTHTEEQLAPFADRITPTLEGWHFPA